MDISSLISIVITVATSVIPLVHGAIRRRRRALVRQKLLRVGIAVTIGSGLLWTLTRKR